jgi:acyl carrier protein
VSSEVFERIARVAASTFNCDASKITARTIATDVAGWDSLSHVYFVLAVEREFGLKLPTREVINVANVGDLVKLVSRQLEQS